MLQSTLTALKIIAIAYVLCATFLYFAQDALLFFPQPLPASRNIGLQPYELSINRNGITLKGWLQKEQISQTKPLIIYYGGNAEEVSSLAAESHLYSGAGGTLFMNYRGYGASQGKPSQKALFDDALFILDTIAAREKIPMDNIVLLGRSLGSAIAVHVADKRAVRAVILVTAFDSILNVAQKRYPIFPIRLLLKHPFNSEILAPNINKPLLSIVADNDEIIPKQHALNLANKWQGPVTNVTIKNAKHNDIDNFPEYWQTINIFIAKVSK
nr:alpha/beta hydrolase [Desulfobulbaceae bacterium]